MQDIARRTSRLHIHGFTALEVTEGARRLGESRLYLKRAVSAGLKSLPGTAAEILDDNIREFYAQANRF